MAKNPLTHFKTFPEFSTLTFADRDVYLEFIEHYPPCSALAFGTLMTWWNSLAAPRVAHYGDNLVISLWLPGDEKFSGLTVLGAKNVDETICAVFDFQRSKAQERKLVHVPEFVVSKIRFPDLFKIEGEREHDECLLDVESFLQLGGYPVHQRSRIRRFLAEFGPNDICIREIDLRDSSNKELLLDLAIDWKDNGGLNTTVRHEDESFTAAVKNAEKLDYRCLGFYISDVLHGYLLLLPTTDLTVMVIAYARFSYEYPHLFETAVYSFAKWFTDEKIKFVNIDADFDLPILRNTKLSLGPSNFLRMYSLRPTK